MSQCPKCRSARFYPSRIRSVAERVRTIFGERRPYRCHSCNHRGWYRMSLAVAGDVEITPEIPSTPGRSQRATGGGRDSRDTN